MKLLFVVEGNTDIRFVDGLSRQFELTLLVPERQFSESGLKNRIQNLALKVNAFEIPGGRLAYQIRSFWWLLKHGKTFDVILAQEMLRGALNANVAGFFLRVPTVNYVGIPAVEYFDCRWERRQISYWKWRVGRTVIKSLLRLNGWLATAVFGMGDFHRKYIARFNKRSYWASYYGVDLGKFRPASPDEKRAIRERLRLPLDAFLVLNASRVSHEKDPETLLLACQQVRYAGVPLHLLNLGGGYEEFLRLSRRLLGDTQHWIEGRSAIHPMEELGEYYRACDVLVQSSLQEGVAYCTMEALACRLPVIASDVGGMKDQLGPYAALVSVRDEKGLTREILALFRNPSKFSARSDAGEKWVNEVWECEKGFSRFKQDLNSVVMAKRR